MSIQITEDLFIALAVLSMPTQEPSESRSANRCPIIIILSAASISSESAFAIILGIIAYIFLNKRANEFDSDDDEVELPVHDVDFVEEVKTEKVKTEKAIDETKVEAKEESKVNNTFEMGSFARKIQDFSNDDEK